MHVTETNFGHLHEEFILRRWGYHTPCRADDEVELQESSGTMKQKDLDIPVSSRQQSEDRLKTSQTLQVQVSVLSQAAVCREGPFSKTNPSHSSPNYLLLAELPEGPLNFSKCHQKNRTNFMGRIRELHYSSPLMLNTLHAMRSTHTFIHIPNIALHLLNS